MQVLAPNVKNLEVTLWERFFGFFHSLLTSASQEVVILALLAYREIRSNLGANLASLKEKTKLDPWSDGKEQLSYALEKEFAIKIPDEDFRRPPFRHKLLIQRLSARYAGDKEEEERLTNLIDSLVIN